jgi:peptidoglycan/LPS O-acetylase OafA/YrhL
MSLDRETVTQIVLSFVAVLLFIVGSLFVSTNYGSNGNLTEQGGVALVVTIGAFVVVMLAAGLYLERREF